MIGRSPWAIRRAILGCMGQRQPFLNAARAAILLGAAQAGPGWAEDARVADLLDELQRPDLPNWKQVEEAIWSEWSRSGSPALDLLLERGREALEAGDTEAAIAHLTALTDHAPDFAEGFNARALAYYRVKRYGPALADLARTLELNPAHFGALMGVGTILEEAGRYDEALRAYEAARAIHPHEPDLEKSVQRLEERTSGQTL